MSCRCDEDLPSHPASITVSSLLRFTWILPWSLWRSSQNWNDRLGVLAQFLISIDSFWLYAPRKLFLHSRLARLWIRHCYFLESLRLFEWIVYMCSACIGLPFLQVFVLGFHIVIDFSSDCNLWLYAARISQFPYPSSWWCSLNGLSYCHSLRDMERLFECVSELGAQALDFGIRILTLGPIGSCCFAYLLINFCHLKTIDWFLFQVDPFEPLIIDFHCIWDFWFLNSTLWID